MTTPENDIAALYRQFRAGRLTPAVIVRFQSMIYRYFRSEGRRFPWRETDDPYHILVSEIMLQQTQASRVLNKYPQFIAAFPTFRARAAALLRDILAVWQGMGYNRRAINLQKTAAIVTEQHAGSLPETPEELVRLPGIGVNTAGAIAAIAFRRPAVFIETNIRAVFHAFFMQEQVSVTDAALRPYVTATLDAADPRQWYYALYDYGAMLKRKKHALPNAAYRKQSPFRGSNRQVRGAVLRVLVSRPSLPAEELADLVAVERNRLDALLSELAAEGFITIDHGTVTLQTKAP